MANRKTVNKTGLSRLSKDYMRIKNDPVPYIEAEPQPSNIFIWHYVVKGPSDSPYAGGYYHGKMIFPPDFPFKPPSILMLTPSGRFQVNTRLCLSISDYHPDTWNPAWSVSTILTGLLSFMLETTPTTGSVETSSETKRNLAYKSGEYNLKDKDFCELFPLLATDIRKQIEKRKLELLNALNGVNSNLNGLNGRTDSNETSTLYKFITNGVFLAGVALFAYVVKCILRGASEDY